MPFANELSEVAPLTIEDLIAAEAPKHANRTDVARTGRQSKFKRGGRPGIRLAAKAQRTREKRNGLNGRNLHRTHSEVSAQPRKVGAVIARPAEMERNRFNMFRRSATRFCNRHREKSARVNAAASEYGDVVSPIDGTGDGLLEPFCKARRQYLKVIGEFGFIEGIARRLGSHFESTRHEERSKAFGLVFSGGRGVRQKNLVVGPIVGHKASRWEDGSAAATTTKTGQVATALRAAKGQMTNGA